MIICQKRLIVGCIIKNFTNENNSSLIILNNFFLKKLLINKLLINKLLINKLLINIFK